MQRWCCMEKYLVPLKPSPGTHKTPSEVNHLEIHCFQVPSCNLLIFSRLLELKKPWMEEEPNWIEWEVWAQVPSPSFCFAYAILLWGPSIYVSKFVFSFLTVSIVFKADFDFILLFCLMNRSEHFPIFIMWMEFHVKLMYAMSRLSSLFGYYWSFISLF